MTIRDFHFAVEQGLTTIGVFNNADMQHDEIDLAINAVVHEEIRNIFRDIDNKQSANNVERNQYQADFLSVIKESKVLDVVPKNGYYEAGLPSDYMHLLSTATHISAQNCTNIEVSSNNGDKLVINTLYKAKGDVKVGVVWYKDGELFVATDNGFYGVVYLLPSRKVNNRLLKSEEVPQTLNGALSTTSVRSPITELIGNKIIIHTLNKFKVNAIHLVYIRNFVKANYHESINLEFREDVLYYLVERVVQYISIRIGRAQQEIVNMKNETVEN